MKHQDVDSDIEEAYPEAYRLARMFHELYEEYAPQFGYETQEETKEFKPSSPNGRLMAKVCHEIVTAELDRQRGELLNNVNRVEVIDHTGRAYTFWEDKADVTMAIQDEGRTLKVFVNEGQNNESNRT